jgi:hypothetical protein
MQYPMCSGNSCVDLHHVDLMKLADLAGLSMKPQVLRLIVILCCLKCVSRIPSLAHITNVRKLFVFYLIFEIGTKGTDVPKLSICQNHATACKPIDFNLRNFQTSYEN